MSDHAGAKLYHSSLPPVLTLIACKGFASDAPPALSARDFTACVPYMRNRKRQHLFARQFYKTQHEIENMFARLESWRQISTGHDGCDTHPLSVICIAAPFIFCLNH